MARQVKTKSGRIGWRDKLKNVYSSFDEFLSYCEIYNNHKRLGFSTPTKAWAKNPTIEGSTLPSDYRTVKM